MRIVKMNGGLGNQLFQYIFMRYIEEKSGESCIIDDLDFCSDHVMHNGYEIEKVFSLKPTRLSEQLDRDVIDEMRRLTAANAEPNGKPESILSVFKSCGIDLFPIQEGNFFKDVFNYSGPIFSTPANEFYPDVLRCSGDLYYYGYWINAQWMASIINVILRELTFPPIPDAKTSGSFSRSTRQDSAPRRYMFVVATSRITAGFCRRKSTKKHCRSCGKKSESRCFLCSPMRFIGSRSI